MKDNGGSAFPVPTEPARSERYVDPILGGCGTWIPAIPAQPGMTLRDYFAAQALTGYIAAFSGPHCNFPAADAAATRAYKYADAMIAERNKTDEGQET
jgi:hypothetical protein